MRSLYARLHSRFGEPIDRRDMIRRSLAAAAGVLLSERFSVELFPASEAAETKDDPEEQEVLSTPDIEPYEDGRIDVGAIVYEHLSAALDPYPRKEGVEFDWVDPKIAADPTAVSPFAALAKLKPKV